MSRRAAMAAGQQWRRGPPKPQGGAGTQGFEGEKFKLVSLATRIV